MNSSGKTFISYLGYAGLGNRINTIISDLIIFNEIYTSVPKVFYWPLIKDRFEDIFQPIPGTTIVNSLDKNIYYHDAKKCKTKYYIRDPNGFILFKKDIHLLKNNKSYYTKFNGTLCYTYDRTPQTFINRYLKYIKMLKPQNDILKEVEKYWSNIGLTDNIVAVHIRQGDFNKHKDRKVDINKFLLKMKHIYSSEPNTIFYLSTDDDNLYTRISKLFPPDTVITYKHIYDDRKHSDFKTALICLLILSKPKRMILTNHSTYSQLAWWLGGCNASVDIISNSFQDNYDNVHNQ